MKKSKKSLIISALTAIAFGSITVGTTFALFTEDAATNVEITSANIKLNCTPSITSAWEIGNTPMTPTPGMTGHYNNSIGGTVYIDDQGIVRLYNIAAGDGATININPTNVSTVKTKARLKVSLLGEFADALTVKVENAAQTKEIDFRGAKTVYTPWVELLVGSNPEEYNITIQCPDNTDITQFFDSRARLVATYEIIQGNVTVNEKLDQINTTLAKAEMEDGSANKTMYDALQDLNPTELDTVLEEGYVWNVKEDKFYSFGTAPANAVDYFKIYDAMPTTQNYSIYAKGTGWASTINNLTVGFDAGEIETFTDLTYNRADATEGQEVTIRTNTANTNLIINAPLDTVHHFGPVGSLNLIAVANSSYHEFGKVAFAEIKTGRIVLEKDSGVNHIHINKKTDSSFDAVTIANNGGAAELPQAITRDQVDVSEASPVVTVVSNGQSETVYVYPYTDSHSTKTGSTEQTTTQNADVTSALGQLVLDDGNDAGQKAMSQNEKEEVEEAAVDSMVDDEMAEKYPDFDDYVARIGLVGYESLNAAIEAAENGDKVVLLKDVDLGADGALLVNKTITLDMNGKSITGSKDPMIVVGSNVAAWSPASADLTHTGNLTIRGNGSITSTNWDLAVAFADATLNIIDGTFTGWKSAINAKGGTVNIYGGNFTATSLNETYILYGLSSGVVNVYAGTFTGPDNGCVGIYATTGAIVNVGELGSEGPTFNTWRCCISTNGSYSYNATFNIYSGSFTARRSTGDGEDRCVIMLANDRNNTLQQMNIYGGRFEQTGGAGGCIFNLRYDCPIELNISGGTFVYNENTLLFTGYGKTSNGYPSLDNISLTVENGAITGEQTCHVYNSGTEDLDFVIWQGGPSGSFDEEMEEEEATW